MRYFSFTRKPDELNFFFPLTSLDSFGFLVYLSVFCFVYFFTSLRDSTHPEHMQVPWFTLPRYTPSLSYIGRSISPSFPYLKEEEKEKYVLWPPILHESSFNDCHFFKTRREKDEREKNKNNNNDHIVSNETCDCGNDSGDLRRPFYPGRKCPATNGAARDAARNWSARKGAGSSCTTFWRKPSGRCTFLNV